MPAGWSKILKVDTTDADLAVGVDQWSVVEMNRTRNNFKLLGSLRQRIYFAMARELSVTAAAETLAPGHGLPITINWSQMQPSGVATYTAMVSVGLYTNDAATSVTGLVKRTSGTPANILTFGPSSTVAWTFPASQAFPASETGTQTYEFYVLGSNGTNGIRAIAAVDFYAP